MNNWKNRLAAFMAGRYGMDSLYHALMILGCVLLLFGGLFDMLLFTILAWICLGVMLFRFFSRDYARRRAENEKFQKLWKPVRVFFSLQWRRIRECRTHVYRKCPQCSAQLRFPRRRGKHTAVCPRCAHRFDVQIYF